MKENNSIYNGIKRKIKCVEINLTEQMYLYIENSETLLKEMNDLNKGKDILYSRIGRFN